MTKKEIRELESWIAVNLFGWDLSRDGLSKLQLEFADEFSGFPPDSIKWRSCCCPHRVPDYTTDPAASRELEIKLVESHGQIVIDYDQGEKTWTAWLPGRSRWPEESPTIGLCLAKLSKQSFSK
jgi:hypothetical protein